MNSLKQMFHYVRYFSRGQRALYLIVLLLGVAGALSEAIGLSIFIPLLLSGEMPDVGFAAKIKDWVLTGYGIKIEQGLILKMMFVVFSFRGLLKFLDHRTKGLCASNFIQAKQKMLIHFLSNIKFSEFQKRNKGEITALFTSHLSSSRIAFVGVLNQLLALATFLCFLITALLINYQMVLIAAGVGLIYFICQKALSRRITHSSMLLSKNISDINSTLIQTLGSLKYLKATNSFKPLVQHLSHWTSSMHHCNQRIFLFQGISVGLQQPVSVGIFIALVYWSTRYQNLGITIVIANMAVIQKMVQSALTLLGEYSFFAEHKVAVNYLIDQETKIKNSSDKLSGKLPAKFLKQLHFNKVSLELGENKVLNDIKLSISANAMVGFTGGSGSGKSTLLDLITGVHSATSGEITVDGISLQEIDIREWQSSIGIVSQEIPIFNDSIFNNVTFWQSNSGSKEANEKEAWEALTLALADDFVRQLPQGIHTAIGEKGVTLSGGQKQRIAIARELYKKPKILILDEATSALDSQSERAIQETLEAIKGHTTVILVAHRLSTLQLCDQIYVLENGTVLEHGPFEVLFSDIHSHFRKLWDSSSLAPKGPSTRIKPTSGEWTLQFLLGGQMTPIEISNISETGVAVIPTATLEELPPETLITGVIQHGSKSGKLSVRVIHRFGGILGCSFQDLDAEMRFYLNDYIKNNSAGSLSQPT